MTQIQIGTSDWSRTVAKEAQIPLFNRYFETDPTNPADQNVALLARPALRKWLTVGAGPIRGMVSQLGMFNNSLFVVSDATLYMVDPTAEAITALGSGLAGSPNNYVPMCITDNYVFVADGVNLWYYTNNSFSTGTLTVTGVISAGEVVQINGIYYKFVAVGTVDTGTPAGTSANPWLVSVGADASHALANLANAIKNGGTPGTDYSTLLTSNSDIIVVSVTSTTLQIQYVTAGTGGNAISTTETLANGAWGGTTLSGGGSTAFSQIPMPDGVGACWVDTINSFVIVVVAQGYGKNGRFYWVWPKTTVVNALDFATAERAPDPLYSVMTLGDQFFLFGSSTTEIWYPTGNGSAPFQRIQGRLFDKGIWGGTAVKIGDEMIVTDRDGVVWRIGQGINRVSNNGIEQRIREAMNAELRT